ncbi:FecR domain-containing protein [Pontibacter litorisediminis]|uniref:FecR domain-containing protein n=1 Tax=Pontibacter litorisediminis TaxID=1846260 RepID=UPI0023ED4D10|nr:FecR domain-containing protein [Pontibacter litorisediminis]
MENHEEHFKKASLLLRYLRGELTLQEEEDIERWIREKESHKRLVDKLRDEQVLEEELHFFSSLDTDKAWQRITSQAVDHEPVKTLWRNTTVWKYAAVVALVLSAALVIYQAQIKTKHSPEVTATSTLDFEAQEVLPGGDKAKLAVSDGAVFVLEDMANGTVLEENGVRVSKQDGVVQFEIAAGMSEKVLYNTISTPVGGQYQVVLPDGSKVWLNSASSLRFPSAFVESERNVELTGEGYFEVASNKEQPFKVKVNTATVEVLGTHFNIMAYASEGHVTATLLEGSVKVNNGSKSKKMVPGQQADIGEDILLKEVDVDEAVAWKNGLFYFNNEDIATVMRQLERWYGIEVAYSGEMSSKHFSGIISRNTQLDKVLEMLALTGSVRFETEGRKVVVRTM